MGVCLTKHIIHLCQVCQRHKHWQHDGRTTRIKRGGRSAGSRSESVKWNQEVSLKLNYQCTKQKQTVCVILESCILYLVQADLNYTGNSFDLTALKPKINFGLQTLTDNPSRQT